LQTETNAFFASALSKQKRPRVGSLDPPVNLAFARNTGSFSAQLIQFPAVGSYNQTVCLDHENALQKQNQTTKDSTSGF
jgi:hypothetical protein